MTFKEALQNDTKVFTNPDEFGVVAWFSRSDSNVNVLLDKEQEPETGRMIDVLTVAVSDVVGLAVGDTFIVENNKYRNVSPESIPVGECMLMIRVENDGL